MIPAVQHHLVAVIRQQNNSKLFALCRSMLTKETDTCQWQIGIGNSQCMPANSGAATLPFWKGHNVHPSRTLLSPFPSSSPSLSLSPSFLPSLLSLKPYPLNQARKCGEFYKLYQWAGQSLAAKQFLNATFISKCIGCILRLKLHLS